MRLVVLKNNYFLLYVDKIAIKKAKTVISVTTSAH